MVKDSLLPVGTLGASQEGTLVIEHVAYYKVVPLRAA